MKLSNCEPATPQTERNFWIIRPARQVGHTRFIAVLPDWWDGRELTAMVPKAFLLHFHSTFLIAAQEELLAISRG